MKAHQCRTGFWMVVAAVGLSGAVVASAVPTTNDLAVWLDASDSNTVTQSGGAISQWSDKSGNGYHATQATVSQRPAYVSAAQNGLNAIAFTSTQLQCFAVGYQLPSNHTAFAVINAVNCSYYSGILSAANPPGSDTGFQLRRDSGFYNPPRISYFEGASGGEANGAAVTLVHADNAQEVIAVSRSASTALLSVQGTVASAAATTWLTSDTTIYVGGRLGSGTWDATFLNGQMDEVLVYGRTLNSAERIITENYLAAKWGATLAANDKYAGDTAGNGDYDFNVFGLGKESDGAVSSGTSGRGLQLTELSGSLAAGEYLLAGDKGVSANSVVSTISHGQRWSRVWYLDKTGTLDARLAFSLSDGNAAFTPGVGKYRLLYAATSILNFADLGLTAMLTGGQPSFDLTDTQLQDGYYTLAQIPTGTVIELR
jgi:hypothetical protein